MRATAKAVSHRCAHLRNRQCLQAWHEVSGPVLHVPHNLPYLSPQTLWFYRKKNPLCSILTKGKHFSSPAMEAVWLVKVGTWWEVLSMGKFKTWPLCSLYLFIYPSIPRALFASPRGSEFLSLLFIICLPHSSLCLASFLYFLIVLTAQPSRATRLANLVVSKDGHLLVSWHGHLWLGGKCHKVAAFLANSGLDVLGRNLDGAGRAGAWNETAWLSSSILY